MSATPSTPEADLIAAILADANADQPRLSYASWCAAHDPDRARIIRLQVQANQGEKGRRTWRSEREKAEVHELIDRSERQWAGGWHAWLPERTNERHRWDPLISDRGFARGFIEYLRMTAAEFLAHGEQIKRQTPLRHLDVIGKEDDHAMRELLANPVLIGLRSMRIVDHPLSDDHLALLVRSPHVTGLEWLVMDADRITKQGVAEIAASRFLANLQRFESGSVSIADHNYSLDGMSGEPAYSTITPECQILTDRYGFLPWARSSYHWWKEDLDQRITGNYP